MFNIADLLNGTVILFNMPVFVMMLGELLSAKEGKLSCIGQKHGAMAGLSF
jgi:hypothetical protein